MKVSEILGKGDDFELLLDQERLIMEVTEAICAFMEERGISRKELAEKIGKTRGYVSQVLSGKNVTLNTLAELVWGLDGRFEMKLVPKEQNEQPLEHDGEKWQFKWEPADNMVFTSKKQIVSPKERRDEAIEKYIEVRMSKFATAA